MNYQTFQPHPHLASLIDCYWTLDVPAVEDPEKQRIIPDECIEMAFILGDDIKRYTSQGTFVLQPRAMVLGQTIEPFYIEPTGDVKTFAVRFYPYGFANFITKPIKSLINTETAIDSLFDKTIANKLEANISNATNTEECIKIIESFLFEKLNEKSTVDAIVKSTVETLLSTKGSSSINNILKEKSSNRRQLERKFRQQIGISPKQLSKIIRLQSALSMLLSGETDNLTSIAYENEYYDQAHFIKDFKEFTGVSPKHF